MVKRRGDHQPEGRRLGLPIRRNGLALLLIAAGLCACAGRDEPSVGSADNPLVMIFSPAHAPAQVTTRCSLATTSTPRLRQQPLGLPAPAHAAAGALRPLGAEHLRVRRCLPVDAIEQLGARKADAGILTLDEFLLAREEYGVEEDLQVLRE